MGKDSKKAQVKARKPITDFFTRKSAAMYVSSQPKLSTSGGGQSQPVKSTRAQPPPRLEKPSISVSSDSSISVSSETSSTVAASDASSSHSRRSRTFMEAVEIVSPRRSAKAQSGSQYLQPPSNNSLKRPHSPDAQNIASLSPRSPRSGVRSPIGKPSSRKSKFDTDSAHDQPDSIIYVSKSVRPATSAQVAPFSPKENLTSASLSLKSDPRKKPRLSTPEPFIQSLARDFVPSSVSEEREMGLQQASRKTHQVAKQKFDDWLQNTPLSPAGGLNDEMLMDVDVPAFPPATEPSFALGNNLPSTLFASPVYHREDTPPRPNRLSSLSPLPPSPMVLDREAKSAQIIADIKAKAYAASMSSPPDSPPVQFKEELDDSDEEDLFSFSPAKGKDRSLSKLELPEFQPPSMPAPRRSDRYSLRSREQSPSPSSSKRQTPLSSSSPPLRATSSGGAAPVQARGKKQSKAKAYDPLEELLKEKRLADKRGKGLEAFRLAEVAVAGKDALLEEMDGEDWTNEDAARTAVAERERMEMRSSPTSNDISNDEMVLDAGDRQRLLGEERGKAIEDILDGDRAKTRREKENEKVFGVPLWSEGTQILDDHMAIDHVVPIPELKGSHPILRLLRASMDRKDFTQAVLLVDSGAVTSISSAEHASVIPYFCELALSCQEGPLNASSFRLLRNIWDNSSCPAAGISFSCILSCLVRIGAKLSVLESMGWTVVPGLRHEATAIQNREDILYRLVSLLMSSARRKLSNDDVPDILMAMLLVANDPSSSVELQREIMLAVDEVCQSIASGADISAPLESTICTRVLKYTSTLEPINKAYVVSVLEGGSGRTRRIARWIAHAIITEKPTVTAKSYSDLPSLLPILNQLSGRNHASHVATTPGKLEIHENTDYIDMGFYVQILAVALSNVMAYGAKDRKAPRPKPSTSGSPDSPDKPPPETMLELIVKEIMALHSSISDTRAAHLERSRTKAALNEVAMRVHYQRMSSAKSSTAGTGKPRGLLQYFTASS